MTMCELISNIVLNAGNKDIDYEHFKKLKSDFAFSSDVKIEKVEDHSLLSVQGPKAQSVLQPFFSTPLSKLYFMSFIREKLKLFGEEVTLNRTGYTGEDGFELSLPNSIAEKFLEELLNTSDVYPAGLGARDALRLEAGLCLHGHDIKPNITPVESLLQWTIRKKNNFVDFVGFEKLQEVKSHPVLMKRSGIMMIDKGIPREGCKVYDLDDKYVGLLTSGGYSPILKKGIGMGYLLSSLKPGSELKVDIRGRIAKAAIQKMPFVQNRYYKENS